ncbi:MAG: hypothetical protein Q7R77_02055 [Candidatus Daviesbacteria bacterium]|nr:hypothetical protein [Candidatus Daviesbacteria bacterium]
MPKLNQKGIFPIILIIILTVVVAGVAGVVYQSRKEIKIRSDKTTEVTELKGTPSPEPKNAEIELANSGRLADKPFEQKTDNGVTSSPNFSITPPAGWSSVPTTGNYVAEFLSSAKDKIEEELAWISVQPSISVNFTKADYQNLDEAMENSLKNKTNPNHKINSKQKIKVNGEDAYVLESNMDIREVAKDIMESQVREELAKAAKEGNVVSQKEFQQDMSKVLEKANLKILSYVFYKDGYFVTVAGKALESFWDKRGPQIKSSMDTFKFE